jgi:hypothetical protein
MLNENQYSEKSMEILAPALKAFWAIYSPNPETGDMIKSNHEVKDTESQPKKQKLNLSKPFCANCGRPAMFGMFCSISCESQTFGI